MKNADKGNESLRLLPIIYFIHLFKTDAFVINRTFSFRLPETIFLSWEKNIPEKLSTVLLQMYFNLKRKHADDAPLSVRDINWGLFKSVSGQKL